MTFGYPPICNNSLRKKFHPSWWRTESVPDYRLGDLRFKAWSWKDFFSFFGPFLFHVICP